MQRNDTLKAIFDDNDDVVRRVLSYWRTIPAESFDSDRLAELAGWLRRLSSTSPEWRSAISGDAAEAIGIVLRLWPPRPQSPLVDVVMTILLASALENAAAANVLSATLLRMPIPRRRRKALALSWSRHQSALARRAASGVLTAQFLKSPRSQT